MSIRSIQAAEDFAHPADEQAEKETRLFENAATHQVHDLQSHALAAMADLATERDRNLLTPRQSAGVICSAALLCWVGLIIVFL